MQKNLTKRKGGADFIQKAEAAQLGNAGSDDKINQKPFFQPGYTFEKGDH